MVWPEWAAQNGLLLTTVIRNLLLRRVLEGGGMDVQCRQLGIGGIVEPEQSMACLGMSGQLDDQRMLGPPTLAHYDQIHIFALLPKLLTNP